MFEVKMDFSVWGRYRTIEEARAAKTEWIAKTTELALRPTLMPVIPDCGKVVQ